MQFSSVVVFCGSKSGLNPVYEKHAAQLGKLLAQQKISLVYGGGNRGLMGIVSSSVMANGGQVTGIIPQLLTTWENQHDGISELIVVENMHVRKRLLYEKAEAAIILPGGFGSLDELFEILTWNQLSIHHKPVFLLNSEGFYDGLLMHLEKMATEGFLYYPVPECITILNTPEELFAL
jgi:hypothetical protein